MLYESSIADINFSGNMYLASDHVDMSWSCDLTVAARQSWAEWRKSVFGMFCTSSVLVNSYFPFIRGNRCDLIGSLREGTIGCSWCGK